MILEGKELHRKHRYTWYDSVKIYLKAIHWKGTKWFHISPHMNKR
jgi:hypothetical protein